VRLLFDRGTILFHDVPAHVELGELPGRSFDSAAASIPARSSNSSAGSDLYYEV